MRTSRTLSKLKKNYQYSLISKPSIYMENSEFNWDYMASQLCLADTSMVTGILPYFYH